MSSTPTVGTRSARLIATALLSLASTSLGAAYLNVGPSSTEAEFTRAVTAKGYLLDVGASRKDRRSYKNLNTEWEIRADLKNGRVAGYIVILPYDLKFSDVAPSLKTKLGKPWKMGEDKLAWMTDANTLTTFQQSWMHYEIKSVSLNSEEGRDLREDVTAWAPPAASQPSAVAVTRATTCTPTKSTPPAKPYPGSAFQDDFDAERYCLQAIERQVGQKVIQSRGGSLSANQFEVGKLKSWVWKPRIRVMNTGAVMEYTCVLYDDGRRDIRKGW